ncbi:MAG: hypothetical protein Q9194_000088 [Teloschistes cf. exilis]
MPMMMDDELDDLFGDQNLPSLTPVPRGLDQRIDHLRSSSCSQRIAWSNQGCIASIAENGCHVILRNLNCDPLTGLWRLSQGEDAKVVSTIHAAHALKHLSWNHSGTELAVTDIFGSLSIFSVSVAINRCTVTKRCAVDAEDNLNAIVGLAWLHQDRTLLLPRPAAKLQDGQWAFSGYRPKLTGPHNPHVQQTTKNKAAFVTVTRTAVLRMVYQGPDGTHWLEFRGELDTVSIPSDLLTHVAICADKDSSLLIATYGSESIRTYRVEVDWQAQRFLVEHLKTIEDLASTRSNLDPSVLPSMSAYPRSGLYHLEILPSAPDVLSKETLPPVLLAFFCSGPIEGDHTTLGASLSTTIVRWELSSLKPELHSSFLQLASKKSGAGLYVDLQSFLPVVLSVASLRLLQVPQAYIETLTDDAVIETIIAALVIQFSIACSSYGNHHDDISATMQLFQKDFLKDDWGRVQNFTNAFLNDMYRIVSLDVDYSGDKKTETYLKSGLYQKTLSMQLSLGYWGEQRHRSLSSKLALAILQLRWAALTFAMGFRTHPSGSTSAKEAEAHRAEAVRSFYGIISWILSLRNFVVDEIITLATRGINRTRVHELNTPALALIFVSQSRLLFKYVFRFIRMLGEEAQQHGFKDPVWRELTTLLSKSPAGLHQFEKFFADVEKTVRQIYDNERVSDAERRDIEREMLISGCIPPRLWPAVEVLFTTTLDVVLKEFNVADLFFHDISWLGLSDDPESDRWREKHRLDVIRKIELPMHARIRRCTRCCSVMEDIAPPRGAAGWLINMWRSCICGNWWMGIKGEDETSNGKRQAAIA